MGDVGLVVVAYLLGSLPTAYLITKAVTGRDIRRLGSGNVGGLNAGRNAGVLTGVLTALVDAGKGYLAAALAQRFGHWAWLPLAAALAVIVGHNWMLFLGFRGGGKGLGAGAGAFLRLNPWVLLMVVALFGLAGLVSRDFYIGVVGAVLFLPLILGLFYPSAAAPIYLGAAMAVAIVAKHVPNIRAYVAGKRELL